MCQKCFMFYRGSSHTAEFKEGLQHIQQPYSVQVQYAFSANSGNEGFLKNFII